VALAALTAPGSISSARRTQRAPAGPLRCLSMMTSTELTRIVGRPGCSLIRASVRDPLPHSDGDKPGGPVLVCYHILAEAPAPHSLRRPAAGHTRRRKRRRCRRRECRGIQLVADHAVFGLGHMLRLGVLDNDGDDLRAVAVGNGCGCIDRHAGDAQHSDSTRQEGAAPLAPFPRSFIHIPTLSECCRNTPR
jgi:hypothetical protein